tara:strand:- start:343 stop:522 length:180 start_codon:yes stop_codon:yes gene_type:complete
MSSSDENNDLDSIDIYTPKEESELQEKINELSNAGLYKFAFFTWLFDSLFYLYEKIFRS